MITVIYSLIHAFNKHLVGIFSMADLFALWILKRYQVFALKIYHVSTGL